MEFSPYDLVICPHIYLLIKHLLCQKPKTGSMDERQSPCLQVAHDLKA